MLISVAIVAGSMIWRTGFAEPDPMDLYEQEAKLSV